MRSRVTSLLPAVLLATTACGGGLSDEWDTFGVSGTITDAQGQFVRGIDVRVITWAPNQCGTGLADQLAVTLTNSQGVYSVRLSSIASTYSACFRVSAGSVTKDTTLIDKPAFQAVQVNLVVP